MHWRVMSGYDGCMHRKRCIDYNAAYVSSVDQVLQQRKDQNIKSLHLSFCLNYTEYMSDIDRWISFATAMKGLENIELEFICSDFKRDKFDPGDQYVVRDSWLSQFPYLKKLHLGTCILEFQSEFRLKNIKTLNLSYVTLRGVDWQSIVSSSTNLEWLRLAGCNLPEKLCISKNLECLRFLMVYNCYGLKEIQIHATNLKTFKFGVNETVKGCFSDASKLASLHVVFTAETEQKAECLFCDLIEGIPCLKYLALRVHSPQMYKLPFCKSSSFGSVLSLNLTMNFGDPEVDLVLNLCRMLKLFPQLETLVMLMPTSLHHDKYISLAPSSHTKLRKVKLYRFAEAWTGFARFLLKSALVLDSMILKSYSKFYLSCGWLLYAHDQFRKGESERIRKVLEGKAISQTAKVIIVDGRCKCYDEDCMYAN